jgi:DNA-directed RNA polymerase subunit beta'
MLSSNNILSPANGKPITTPTQDMVLGIYFLTTLREGAEGEGRAFSSIAEALMARDHGDLHLQAQIKIRLDGQNEGRPVETTLGRALFNESLPADYPFVNEQVDKKAVSGHWSTTCPSATARAWWRRPSTGSRHSASTGPRGPVSPLPSRTSTCPSPRPRVLAAAEEKAEKVEAQFHRGQLDDIERRRDLENIWRETKDEVAVAMAENFPERNPVWMMVKSGARG